MKKTLRIIALALIVVMTAAALSACGGNTLSGTYSGELKLGTLAGSKGSYTFSGKNVTITVTTTLLGASNTKEYKGTYELTEATDGTKNIVLTFKDEDASAYSGTFSFENGKDTDGKSYIKIGGITYTAK